MTRPVDPESLDPGMVRNRASHKAKTRACVFFCPGIETHKLPPAPAGAWLHRGQGAGDVVRDRVRWLIGPRVEHLLCMRVASTCFRLAVGDNSVSDRSATESPCRIYYISSHLFRLPIYRYTLPTTCTRRPAGERRANR